MDAADTPPRKFLLDTIPSPRSKYTKENYTGY
jgi:hypothetical protein